MKTTIRHSLRTAIDRKCKDCIYDPLDTGNWRQQVTQCCSKDCPLWPVRPRSQSQGYLPTRHKSFAANDPVTPPEIGKVTRKVGRA